MNTPIERLEIARLVSFIVLDPEKEVDQREIKGVMSDRWYEVSIRSEKRLANFLSRIRQEVNVYVFKSRTFYVSDLYPMVGWDPEFEQYGIKKDPTAINLILTDYMDRERMMPPTAWIILHMMVHTFYENSDVPFYNMWEDFVQEMYEGSDIVVGALGFLQRAMENMMAFRSARNNSIVSIDEAIIELIVETIVYGSPRLKGVPVLLYREQKFHPIDESKQKKIWSAFVQNFSRGIRSELESIRGKYLFT